MFFKENLLLANVKRVLMTVFAFAVLGSNARAESVVLDHCLTAEIDTANFNVLNAEANRIFPYTLEKSQVEGVTQVTPDEFTKRYAETRKDPEATKAYEKLIENVKAFLLTGGILIKTVEGEVMKNRGGGTCGIYNEDKKFPNLFSEVPNINQILAGIFAKVLVESADKHQEKFLGRTADTVYFLIFGYSRWGARNREEFAEYDLLVKCTVDDMNHAVKGGNIVCDDIASKPEFKNYRLFFASSIMNFLLIKDYARKTEYADSMIAYGLSGDYLNQSAKSREKMSQRPWTGGPAIDLAGYGDQVLTQAYIKAGVRADSKKGGEK